jgi:hypothetical protein
MIGSADDTHITPLTTLLFKKSQNGEDVSRFEKMIQNFDPVTAPNRVITNSGIEKVKIEKLIVLIKKLPSQVKENVRKRAITTKKLVKMLKDLDPTKISLNNFFVAVSDGGKSIKNALLLSLIVPLPEGMTLLDFVIKPKLDENKDGENQNTNDIKEEIKQEIVAINSTPTANAGEDKRITEGGSVTLNDSSSKDSDGVIVKDDGFYQKGADTNYTRDDNNETVTDHLTGLMWQDDPAVASVKKQWVTQANYDAQDYNNTVGDTANTYCNELVMGGFEDWRLPTVVELQGIVNDERVDPSIDEVFVNSSNSYYWSSTATHSTHANAWVVYFGYGYTTNNNKNYSYAVRCVRSRQ